MAINKVVNNAAKTHSGMKSLIYYVMQDKKVQEGYVTFQGPFNYDDVTVNNVYHAFIDEKKLWNKDSGRMCAHNIISFHKDEIITPAECLEIGEKFCNRFFPEFQNLIAVHQDKDHLHVHIVTNTVSYVDGHKIHQTKNDLKRQKIFTNNLCKDRGLNVATNGKHFDGSEMEPGEITAWSKNKYKVLTNTERNSYMIDCAQAIVETIPECNNSDEFFERMRYRGWDVSWNESRTHIIFRSITGALFSDINLAGTFCINVGLEDLLYELERAINGYYTGHRTTEDIIIRDAEKLITFVTKLLFSALQSVILNDGYGQRNTASPERASGKGNTVARDERDRFDAFLADINAKARARGECSEFSFGNTIDAVNASRNDRRISSRKASEVSDRDAESKARGRERRSEESEWYEDAGRDGWDLGL